MEFSKDVAKKLQEQRKLKGETQESLALKIGVSRRMVAKWEGSDGGIALNTVEKYCKALGIQPEIIFTELPKSKPKK